VNVVRKITAKDPAKKLAIQRLTVLQLAEQMGNISEVCRRTKMDRTSFYEWKRRFQTPEHPLGLSKNHQDDPSLRSG
jgi:transposase-like protein